MEGSKCSIMQLLCLRAFQFAVIADFDYVQPSISPLLFVRGRRGSIGAPDAGREKGKREESNRERK